jgi:hypothetical protein
VPPSNDWMIRNNYFENMKREAVAAKFKVLLRHLYGKPIKVMKTLS